MSYVRKRRGKWFARWKNANGQWQEQATSARNKTDCERFAKEMEAKGERQRSGLEPLLPKDGGGTVAKLLEWWIDTYRRGAPGFGTEECAIRKHIAPSELGAMTLAAVRSQHVESFLQAKSTAGLAPQTVNHLRAYLHNAFSKARKAGRWPGQNPVAEVQPRKVKLPPAEWLTAEEVRAVLAVAEEPLRSLFAVAAYCGLRWGELAALRKRDVEWEPVARITVQRSWDRDTTKGGRSRVVPVPAECVPFLRGAVDRSPSEYVFPNPDGKPRSRQSNLSERLRSALARAGVVEGFTHVCRARVNAEGKRDKTAPRCTHSEEAPDAALRRCPIHGDKLWPKPKVRSTIHFHTLRHTTGSLLAQARVPIAAISAALGHSDVRLTSQRYAHLSPDYLRAEMEQLRFGVEAPQPTEQAGQGEELRAVAGGFEGSDRALVGREPGHPAQRARRSDRSDEKRPGVTGPSMLHRLERETGFGPATLSLGS